MFNLKGCYHLGIKSKDHKGWEFKSKAELCIYYRITVSIYEHRLICGWSLREVLEGRDIEDHLGNRFDSVDKMCLLYNVEYYTYYNRLNEGWTVEEALTGIRGKNNVKKATKSNEDSVDTCEVLKRDIDSALATIHDFSEESRDIQNVDGVFRRSSEKVEEQSEHFVTDFLGNVFGSKQEMCQFYGVSCKTFDARIKYGWSMKEALLISSVRDFEGKEFSSKEEMCSFWGVTLDEYNDRLSHGLTMKEALLGDLSNYIFKSNEEARVDPVTLAVIDYTDTTKETQEVDPMIIEVTDHLGNKFKNVKEMCDFYKVKTTTYLSRLAMGWTLREALEGRKIDEKCEPTKSSKGTVVTDHKGKQMCSHYGVGISLFNYRLKHGWSLEEALEGKESSAIVTDHKGNEFVSKKQMCDYYGVSLFKFCKRINRGWSLEEALGVKEHNTHGYEGVSVTDHKGNKFVSKEQM